jgi:acid phosphatase
MIAVMVVVFILCLSAAPDAGAQSVLLSNLKPSDQTDAAVVAPTSSAATSSNTRPTTTSPQRPTEKITTSDPFLNPDTSQRTPQTTPQTTPTIGSILQSSGVDGALDSQASVDSGAHEDLDALLWLRTSVEYDAVTRQAFAAATQKLGEALVDPNWKALVAAEQGSAAADDRPPCVIVDVDETMLDNSVFQMERIQSDTEYETDTWNEFVQRRASPAIEGAADFVQACRASGVKVFFVTNREAAVEAATRDNLISQGLMTTSDPDQILSKNEQTDWTSDKKSRRQKVAQENRVLLLIGDDLNDFLSAKNLTIPQRKRLFQEHRANWGQSWFVIPNPNYGSWEQASIGNDYRATLEKKRKLKMETLGSEP